MKKMLSLVIAGILLLSCCIGVGAAVPEIVTPMWDNINTMNNSINFSGTDGVAQASVFGKSGTTAVSGTLEVYKQTTNGWEFVGSDSDSVSGIYMSLQVAFDGEEGEYYKAVFKVSVTRNGVVEPETKTVYKTC